MIHTEKLTKYFGPVVAVDRLDLDVQPGEILGFLGPNGAGKSTTVKMLVGLLQPTSGRATVAGYDVVDEPDEVKRRIGYVPETAAVYDHLTCRAYLDLVAALHHLPRDTAGPRADELLDRFGVGDAASQRLAQCSKGTKQKVLLAAALLHRPEVLILDEPLDGLDAPTAMVVKEPVRRFAEQRKTILFCSHILEVVERICTRIVIINRGHLVASGKPGDIAEAAGARTLEEAFVRLTGVRDVSAVTTEVLAALERV